MTRNSRRLTRRATSFFVLLALILGAVVPSGFLWLTGELFQKLRHKEGLGFGDVKMMAMVGAFLGLRAPAAARPSRESCSGRSTPARSTGSPHGSHSARR